MQDFIIVAVIVVILGTAIVYIRKAKKNGTKCIGCPAGGNCPSHNQGRHGTCNCGCGEDRGSENTCSCECSKEK